MMNWLVLTAKETLNTILRDEVATLVGFTDEIEKLSSTFTSIQALLEDAESRRLKDRAVKIWLEKVKDVAYDVDDILDEWKAEALRSEAVDEGDGSSLSKKRKLTSYLSPSTYINPLMLRHKIGGRIKEVRGRLDDIEKEKSQLCLRVYSGESKRLDSEARQGEIGERETGSLVDPLSIVGREREKDEVIDLLLSESSGEVNQEPIIISLVGMGGLGKTTLAQLIYNDEKVQGGHFEMRMWVCVSEDFDVKQITKSIIESATGSACDNLGLDRLQRRLCEKLQAKRFLLVLDDIWSEDSEKWDQLRVPFQAGALGSRIVITTRSERVALAMGSTHIRNLAVLSHDDCWLLFRHRALKHQSAEERSELEDIGRKIVKKCGGLPLAAKTIGGAMRLRRTRREWELVLESDVWNSHSHDVLQGILPALLLSYNDLCPALKQCFTYLSIFPKDWWIEKDVMVKLWVAQGFIRSDRSGDMEEIGGLYFDDLLRRSLLQDAVLGNDKNILRCKMHDLVHDLAKSVAGSDYSLVEIRKQASVELSNARHSFLIVRDEADEVASLPATLHNAHKLRTLLCDFGAFGKPNTFWYHFSCRRAVDLSAAFSVPNNYLDHFRCLRALDLSGSDIKELPGTVGELKHLRYLNLSGTNIEELPEEVTNCINLQTLKLNNCYKLKKLPRGMRKMISLRHLEIDCSYLSFIPQGIGRLTSLRTLTRFIVGGGDEECKCGELKHLNHLQGSLQIECLGKVRSREEAREAQLYKKQYLHTLSLKYYHADDAEPLDDHKVKRTEDMLEILRPHTNLKEFEINRYEGRKLPKWIEDPVFSNLVNVTLWHCYECKQLPGLGKLPSLKCLVIERMKEVRKVGGEFNGDDNNEGSSGGGVVSFPKLETLKFSHMSNWEEWELRGGDGQVMPSLLQLGIFSCPKLKELPSNLPPLLQKLTLWGTSDVGMSSGGPLSLLPNLDHLEIEFCHELTSLPGGWLGQLKALQTLTIIGCPNLRSLPEELQHLTMLQHLKIAYCPVVLEERCQEGGEDRYKISHIPHVSFDRRQLW